MSALYFIKESDGMAIVQEAATIVSLTDPVISSTFTQSKDKVGLRFSNDDNSTLLRVMLSREKADAFLNQLLELLST